MSINLHLPNKSEMLRPTITVIGVGGAGGNAVNNMIAAKLEGVNFVVANTDAQALENALTQKRIQLGSTSTRGLGAGADPSIGRGAADEAMDEISEAIDGSNMVFITAGMGGGTGTGAAPVVAKLAREQGILTVGVVTKPFHFEGSHRMRLAEQGLQELQQYVDTLIVIPNQNLFRIANEKTTFADAFRLADEVLHSGVRGVTDLMVKPGLVNLDFADIRTVMREMGKAMMGTGEAMGERRAIEAAESAISNPLLDDVSLKGARAVLINITGGMDMTLYEVDEAANRIREEVDPDANIIFGSAFNESMDGKMRVSVVATGIDAASQRAAVPTTAPVTEQRKPYVVSSAARQEAKIAPKPQLVTIAAAPVRSQDAHTAQPAHAASHTGFEFTTEMMSAPLASVGHAPSQNDSAAEPITRPQFNGPQLFTAAPAAPSFAAPSPYAPDTRSQAARPAEETEYRAAPAKDESMSFFQKVAGFGKAMTRNDGDAPRSSSDYRSVQVSEKSRTELTEKAPRIDAEEDYLDIPAFLRRQAN